MDKLTITKKVKSLLQNKSIKYKEIIKADVKRICDAHLYKNCVMTIEVLQSRSKSSRVYSQQRLFLNTAFRDMKPGWGEQYQMSAY